MAWRVLELEVSSRIKNSAMLPSRKSLSVLQFAPMVIPLVKLLEPTLRPVTFVPFKASELLEVLKTAERTK